jgi:hypothetical protein
LFLSDRDETNINFGQPLVVSYYEGYKQKLKFVLYTLEDKDSNSKDEDPLPLPSDLKPGESRFLIVWPEYIFDMLSLVFSLL